MHELYHASQRPEDTDFVVLESPEISEERRGSNEEIRQANSPTKFAFPTRRRNSLRLLFIARIIHDEL